MWVSILWRSVFGLIVAGSVAYVTIYSAALLPEASSGNADCGPRALHNVAAILGVPLEFAEAAQMCPVRSSRGVSIDQLVKAIDECPDLKAERFFADWQYLIGVEDPCILHIRPDHFIVARPTTMIGNRSHGVKIRVYDSDGSGEWVGEEQLKRLWNGVGILVSRREAPKFLDQGANNGPVPVLETLYADAGVVGAEREVTFRIGVGNVGDRELDISIAGTSCSCTKASAMVNRVAPGGTTYITAVVDVSAKKGFFREMLKIRTNSERRFSTVVLAGSVASSPNSLCSWNEVNLGEIPLGATVKKELLIEDPPDGSLTGVAVEIKVGASQTRGVRCSVKAAKNSRGNSSTTSPRSFRLASPGANEWRIEVIADAREATELSVFRGEMICRFVLDGLIVEKVIPLVWNVVSDLRIEPAAFLLPNSVSDQPVARTITIESRTGRSFQVNDVSFSSNVVGKSQNVHAVSSGEKVAVPLELSSLDNSRNVGHIVVKFRGGEEIRVPVVWISAE